MVTKLSVLYDTFWGITVVLNHHFFSEMSRFTAHVAGFVGCGTIKWIQMLCSTTIVATTGGLAIILWVLTLHAVAPDHGNYFREKNCHRHVNIVNIVALDYSAPAMAHAVQTDDASSLSPACYNYSGGRQASCLVFVYRCQNGPT